jgi:AraC-like DNA-binding protein
MPAPAAGLPDRRLSLTRDYLRAYWNRPVTLEQLARQASLSSFELNRRFAAAYGLPPHRYQPILRVIEAKSRLLDGAGISEVALAAGFADQSHFGRLFKAVLGITPGTLAKLARGK